MNSGHKIFEPLLSSSGGAGGNTLSIKSVTFGMSPYSVLSGDDILNVFTTGGNVSIVFLPANTALIKPLYITKSSSDSSVISLTVSGGTHTIMHETLQIITERDTSIIAIPDSVSNYFVE